ncbi:MAG: transposase [Chthoniobacteraceae bacterium]
MDTWGGTIQGLGGESHGVGGIADHVHLLVSLKATHCLTDFMRELKKASSQWMKDTCNLPGFSWQDGYCALTVSPSGRAEVHDYIIMQEEHHRKRTFHEELVEFLEKAGIPYEPKYLV